MNSVSPTSPHFSSFQQWSSLGILAGGIFVIDLFIPLGVAAGILYIAVVLLSLRHQDSQLPLWTAIGCSMLTILALFISPIGGEFWKVLVNRGLALFAIWTTTILGRLHLQQANTNQHNLLLTDRVFMASPDHISILGRDYRYHRVNPSYEKIHGKESQHFVGMSVSDLLGKETFEKTVKPKLDTCFQGEEVHYEAWFRFSDNQDHYMAVSYLPLISEHNVIEEIVVIARDWTEQKKNEEMLQQQALMFNTVYDGLLTTDLNGNITDWNPGAEQMFGYSKEETLGHTPAIVHQPSESASLTQSIIDELHQKGRWQGEINFLRKDRTSGICETIVAPLKDVHGQLIGTIGVNRDMSAKKIAEDRLRKSEERFRTYFETGLVGMAMTSLEQEWLEMNEQLCELLGYSREELEKKTWADLTHPDDLPEDEKNFEEMIAGSQQSYSTSKRYIRKNGSLMYANLYVKAFRNPSGQIEYFTAMIEDISEQKIGEALLMKWAMIFQHTQWGVAVSSGTSTNFEMVNEAYARMHGYAIRELEGMSVTDVVAPEFRIQLPNIIQTIHQDGFFSYEARHMRKDGSTFPTLVTESAIKDINGQTLYRVTNVIDISELKSVEDALKKSEERLSIALEATSSGTWDWNVLTGDVIFGKEWLTSLGYQSQDLQTTVESWKNLVHPDDMPMTLRAINSHFSGETPVYESINRLRMKNGEWRWNLDRGRVVEWTTDGKPLRMVGTDTDITARKEAEEVLRNSQQRFQNYFESGLVGMAITSLEKGWIDVNDRLCDILGYSREELTRKTWTELTYPDDLLPDETEFNKLLAGTLNSYSMEKRFIKKDDTLIFANIYAHAVRKHSGEIDYFTAMIEDITDRKRAEVDNEESRNRFQAIFDDAGIGMALVDIHGHFVESNRSFQAFLGYSAEDLSTLSFEVITHKEHVEKNQNFFEKLKTGTQDSFNMEKQYVRKDGQIVWGHLTVTTIRHASGELQFAIGMIEDITKKKRAEELLTKWATIFQHTQWGVAVGNADSQNLDLVNEAYARMHGYTVEELLGQPIAQVFAPSFRPQLPAFIQKIHEEGFQSIESLHLRKDGTTFPALLTVSAVKDSQGVVLYRVANLIDISNRKMAEVSLKESEQRFRSMFEQAAVGVAQVNSNTGEFIRINQRYCDIVKYSQEEMMSAKFQEITHPADQRADLENMAKLLSGEIAKFSIEKRYVRKDRSVVWIHLTVSPMWQIGEKPSHHIAVVEDITERKSLEVALQKHNEELELIVDQRTERIVELEQRRMQVEKLAALAQIAAGVAHEINNPLASISQSLVLIKRAISPDHPHYRYMEKTEDCVDRIATITKNLYQLYQPSTPRATSIDIRMCIHTATDIMKERAFKHEMQIDTPPLLQPIMAQISQGELIQVLCNLLHNAIDASHREGTIEIGLTTEAKSLTLFVKDYGEGIPSEAAPHIFEPFYTTKQNRTEGGMGLGLSISHSLVEAMGGSLDFSSAMGHGSTFTITLPLT